MKNRKQYIYLKSQHLPTSEEELREYMFGTDSFHIGREILDWRRIETDNGKSVYQNLIANLEIINLTKEETKNFHFNIKRDPRYDFRYDSVMPWYSGEPEEWTLDYPLWFKELMEINNVKTPKELWDVAELNTKK